MSEPARYQRAEQVFRTGQITTSRGVDAVTGLPVFIYDFPGAPRLKVGQLDSEGIPTVLAAGYDGTKGVLVTACPPSSSKLEEAYVTMDDDLVLQALKALRDAARVGLVHGDITPERLLLAHGRVYVEGYGVPWNPAGLEQPTKESIRAALIRDLVATTKALLGFGSAGMSQEVAAALKGALGTASRAGDAGQLYTVVRRLAGGAVTVPPAGFGNLVLPTEGEVQVRTGPAGLEEIGLDTLDVGPVHGGPVDLGPADLGPDALDPLDLDALDLGPKPAAEPAEGPTVDGHSFEEWTGAPTPIELFEESPPVSVQADAGLTTPPFPDEPDPITLHSDPGPTLKVDPALRDSGTGFVKDLPPGATYRAGDPEEPVRVPPLGINVSAVPKPRKRAWRLPILVLTLIIVAGGSAYLALVSSRDAPSGLQGTPAMSHFVDVRVDPPNLPPVSLVVEQRPSASSFRSGTIIASVPRRVRFDAAGVWVVHASFQGRVSESVTVRVPEDTSITIVFPAQEEPLTP